MAAEWLGKNFLFVQRLIDKTLKKEIDWAYYHDGLYELNDENLIFFHHEFCWLDSTNSFFTQIDSTIVILAYELAESGKDGSITRRFKLIVGEPGSDGYISEIKVDDEHYSSLIELSYHIKGILAQTSPKAEKFIDKFLDGE